MQEALVGNTFSINIGIGLLTISLVIVVAKNNSGSLNCSRGVAIYYCEVCGGVVVEGLDKLFFRVTSLIHS